MIGLGQSGNGYTRNIRMTRSKAEMLLKPSGQVFVYVGLAFQCQLDPVGLRVLVFLQRL